MFSSACCQWLWCIQRQAKADRLERLCEERRRGEAVWWSSQADHDSEQPEADKGGQWKLKIRFQKFFIWRSVGVQRDYTTMFDAKMAVICWFNVIYQLRDIKRFEKLCSFCPHCFINVFICKNSSLYLHKLKFIIFSSKNKRTKKIEACKGATIR